MGNASRDDNFVPSLIAVSSSDGKTIIAIKADANHRMKVNDGITGTDHGPSVSPHDSNDIPCLVATSSVDGETPVVIYADSSGNLLIES